jgi:hypothetical protein
MNEEQKHYFRCGQAYAKAVRMIVEIDMKLFDLENNEIGDYIEELDSLKHAFLDISMWLDPACDKE